jgi:hypothetical protein
MKKALLVGIILGGVFGGGVAAGDILAYRDFDEMVATSKQAISVSKESLGRAHEAEHMFKLCTDTLTDTAKNEGLCASQLAKCMRAFP